MKHEMDRIATRDIEAEKGAGRHGIRACQAIAQGRDQKNAAPVRRGD
jgi:hypothetical protein